MRDDLPIFGVCGRSGAGKTTLIEALVPSLLSHNLSVAVAKHWAHGLDVDHPGKDSDRLFRAGADVFLEGPGQGFARIHPSGNAGRPAGLEELAYRYDLVLVEGGERVDQPKVWLLAGDETEPPTGARNVLVSLPRDADRLKETRRILRDWLFRTWMKTPVYGCVLIGGRSSRMGKPKHLLRSDGRTWVECAVAALSRVADRVAVVGAGEVPDALPSITRLPDAPDAEGPMAGILAAMRWAPWVSWLVTACDLPGLSTEALEWLLATRAPGVWAAVPCLPGAPGVEPLLAHYDFRARAIFEHHAADGRFSPSLVAEHPKVVTFPPPAHLFSAWDNVNTPDDLAPDRPENESDGYH